MLYEELYLKYGGGIRPEGTMTPGGNRASLVIGIGGTGIAALAAVRGKIKTRMKKDTDIPILAIDTDPADYKRYRGVCRIPEADFFPLWQPGMTETLQNHGQIMADPLMDWIEIGKITYNLSPPYITPCRQVSRYYMMKRIRELEGVLHQKCLHALSVRNTHDLDVYICANIAGYTGSGCYMDVCYLLRQLALLGGWNVSINGLFFLPDVVTSKPEVMAKPSAVQCINANGYAALKELDYHMDLPGANGRFRQAYGRLTVDTQEPPVDYCHLISAIRADGSVIPNGYSYATDLAAEHILARLTEPIPAPVFYPRILYSYMRSWRAIQNIRHCHDPFRHYYVIGVSRVGIPVAEINTYLVCGFFRRFQNTVGIDVKPVDRRGVDGFVSWLSLRPESFYQRLVKGHPGLLLPDIAPAAALGGPIPAAGQLFQEWDMAGNAWLNACSGKMQANFTAITQPLANYDYRSCSHDSLIEQFFRKLWDMCIDPEFGPYYVVQLLHNDSYDLFNALDEAIKDTDDLIRTHEMHFENAKRSLEECKHRFWGSNLFNRRRNYEDLRTVAQAWFAAICTVRLLQQTATTIRIFKSQAQDLYTGFFKPLIDVLNNLGETFQENAAVLAELPAESACTQPLISLEELLPQLDEAIGKLTSKQLVTNFMSEVLICSDAWLDLDEDKICAFSCKQMLELFKDESARSLETYLFDKYPCTEGDTIRLANVITDDILTELYRESLPNFPTIPQFALENPDNTYQTGFMRLNRANSALASAAHQFYEQNRDCEPQNAEDQSSICSMRLFCGIPLYAYQGINLLKSCYDSVKNTCAGVGIHLYSYTGRGTCADPSRDWLHSLPDLLPPCDLKNYI